eukprot:gene1162-2255_t
MSKSTTGTRSTRDYIDRDSEKYFYRSDLGFSKRGSAQDDMDSAHILSWGLAQTIITNTGGRPMSEETQRMMSRDLNHDSNLRMKSSYGNRILDERRDGRIAAAFVNGDALEGRSTANRAYLAYQSASTFGTLNSVANQLGDMRILNPNTGRTHYVRNHHKYT